MLESVDNPDLKSGASNGVWVRVPPWAPFSLQGMIQSFFSTKVRFPEVDSLGFVYHARYLEWLDAARVQLMDDIEYPYKKLQSMGLNLPLTKLNLEFKAPAYFDDLVNIETKILEKPLARLSLVYTVKIKNKLILEGQTVHFFMNQDKKVAKPPACFLINLSKFWKEERPIKIGL